MGPLIAFGQRLAAANVTGAQLLVTEFPSWKAFFDAFTASHVAVRYYSSAPSIPMPFLTSVIHQVVGSSLALASRLINKSNFATPDSRSALVSGLLAADAATPGLIILISAPSSYPSDGTTSVTDAWRQSLYHVTVVSTWNWNATAQEKKAGYDAASNSIDNLRKITPDAAYLVSSLPPSDHHSLYVFLE
jgi:hypothetical protein